jgi:alpha-L-fucosidase
MNTTRKNTKNNMDEMWGDDTSTLDQDRQRGQDFGEKNYAIFIHFGLYSQIANEWKGKTRYGIGEWIMDPRMADIPIEEYKALANDFNPAAFDADAIVQLAKDAGMRYIVFTTKHHEGFAMYASKVDGFNIVDATPFGRDPLHELAEACKKHGVGLGIYYSHYQDWTAPGGARGPQQTEDGTPVDFDHYFQTKCRPQIEELTANYGPLEVIWFDTPGSIPKPCVEELVAIIRKNQPRATVETTRLTISKGLFQFWS